MISRRRIIVTLLVWLVCAYALVTRELVMMHPDGIPFLNMQP